MSEPGKVECQTHGWQDEAFVCQHIVESLHTGVPVGFHWPEGATELHPDPWFSACESARIEAGGEWTEEVVQQLNIKLLCGACYEHAKGIWSRAARSRNERAERIRLVTQCLEVAELMRTVCVAK